VLEIATPNRIKVLDTSGHVRKTRPARIIRRARLVTQLWRYRVHASAAPSPPSTTSTRVEKLSFTEL